MHDIPIVTPDAYNDKGNSLGEIASIAAGGQTWKERKERKKE